MAPPKLYQDMVGHLEAMIASGAFAAGDRLPAQRELCEKFGLSSGTVWRGLAVLERRGLIRLRRGSGAFVCDRKAAAGAKRRYEIGVVLEFSQPDSTYSGQVLIGVQDRAAELNCGLHLNFLLIADLDEAELAAFAARYDALLLIGPYDLKLTGPFTSRPYVGVNQQQDFGIASLVDLDPFRAAELAKAYFTQRRVRRIVAMNCHPGYCRRFDVFHYRSLLFQHLWEGEWQSWDDRWFLPENRPDGRRMQAMLGEGSGVFTPAGSMAHYALQSYAKATGGRDLSEDFPVLAVDGKALVVPHFQPVDTIGPDYRAMGVCMMDECLRRLEDPGSGPQRIYRNVKLYLKSDYRNIGRTV